MNNLIKAATFNYPDEIPVHVDILPAAWALHRTRLYALTLEYQDVCGLYPETFNFDFVPGKYELGEHTDEWGCTWTNIHRGMDSVCTGHPVKTRQDMLDLEIPNKKQNIDHGFFYQRLVHLRGFEDLMIDLAEGTAYIEHMIKMVGEYVWQQINGGHTCQRQGIVYFGDDLGTQHGLPISPDIWRLHLKSYYEIFFEMIKDRNALVFFHSDGDIWEIIPDLIECGVDILNVQGGLVTPKTLYKIFIKSKRKICADVSLDRQIMYKDDYNPFKEIGVILNWLGIEQGGLWIRAEIGEDVPLKNIEKIFKALRNAKKYYKRNK